MKIHIINCSPLEELAFNLFKERFVWFRFPGYEENVFIDDAPQGWILEHSENFAYLLIGILAS